MPSTCSTPPASSPAGIPGARRVQGLSRKPRSSASISPGSTPTEDRKTELPRRALETAAREGKFENEGWRVRKDGSRFWAYVIIDPIRDSEGKLVGFAKVTRDLTERRAARGRTAQEPGTIPPAGAGRDRLRDLSSRAWKARSQAGTRARNGSRATSRTRSSASISPSFIPRKIARPGFPPSRLKQRGVKEDSREKAFASARTARSSGQTSSSTPSAIGEGVLIGFAKITRDITERKRAEETLERTREALVQSQKMEAIGHLTGGVAHDFNNLLMAIQGSLELMKRRLPSGDDARCISSSSNALQGAQRGAALTQRMLAFARRQELKLQTVNVTELINGMTELLQRSLGASVQIETHFSLGLPKVSADANQLELAILNLSMNARDAMPQGRLHRHFRA